MIISILGRQPQIGLAELEAKFGDDKVQPLGDYAALLDVEVANVKHADLGGSIKMAEIIGQAPTVNWPKVSIRLERELPEVIAQMPEGKITLGISTYGIEATAYQVGRTALGLKKIIRAQGRPVRIVPNTEACLNSAQVLHNNLATPGNMELICASDGHQTYIAKTFSIQNINDYARRDFDRPRRDAFVGMLPPKLAQIMLNLGQAQAGKCVLDPFCGTGVLLQEAALMGCKIYGTDIDERMIRYTHGNLSWLEEIYHVQIEKPLRLAAQDATTATWEKPFDHVICEGYLGKPMTSLPALPMMQKNIADCDRIARQFLQNLHDQLAPGDRICIGLPAWKKGNDFIHLPVVDDLTKIGYNQVSFSYARNSDLIYHRPDQIVARELLVLTRK